MGQTSNKITLDRELVDELVLFQKNIRDNTISMAEKAFGIRSQYLLEGGRKYDAAFEKWWSAYKLDKVFGKRSNFTKWASAGEALEQAKIDKYRNRLPTTMTALYEVSQLSPDELKLGIQDTFTRESLTSDPKGRKKPSPLIHPEVTAAEIKSWRTRWRNPKPKSTEKRRLPYATIKVHGSLYDFDNKGTHSGILTIEKLKQIHDALIKAMKPFDECVLLETKLNELTEAFHKRQDRAELLASKKAAKALSLWNKRVLNYVRKEARRIVRKSKGLRRGQKDLYWDETFIGNDANGQRIHEVLESIGRGDENKLLYDRAYSEIKQPTMTMAESTDDIIDPEVFDELRLQMKKQKHR